MRTGTLLRAVALVIAAATLAGPARAGWHDWWYCRAPCPSCPDDYCPKRLPRTGPVTCFGPDDYCPKRLPRTGPWTCFGPDDYCPRPCPVIVPRCPPPGYSCVKGR